MKRIVCYGDSNTWGHNPEDISRFDENIRWPKVLNKLLGKEYEIIEEGLCGRGAAFVDSGKPYRNGVSSLPMTLEVTQPIDMIIIMLGTNDLKAQFSPTTVSIGNGIKEIIKIIKNPNSYNPHYTIPKILIISPILIREPIQNAHTLERFNEHSIAIAKQLASHYEQICKQFDCLYLDASKYAQASLIDSIHMDGENHQKLAMAIYEVIQNKI